MSNWYAVDARRYLFGYRGKPIAATDWRDAARTDFPLRLESSKRLIDGDEFVGEYSFNSVAEVAEARTDTAIWCVPHPCAALGEPLGFITVRWRAFLPAEQRAALSRRFCFALRGWVMRDADAQIVDPVRLGNLTLGILTSKYGGGTLLFDDEAYRAYIDREVTRVARAAGLWAYRADRLRVEGKLAGRVDWLPHPVEVWHFSSGEIDEAARGGFFDPTYA